ncbi:hypothetical protein DPMN_000614 [Dreissena polymorpha]|uniref:Uncharacterized protein n=1 Tax=Dreissena polymorpha TaxID=45954 RepID=A0A9D4RQ34_DREPO|nr:hypothetical protein DPMN_000614 [Dreissena polymorpha]
MQSPPQSQPPSVLPQSQPPPSYEEVQAMSAVQGHQPYLGPQGYKPEWACLIMVTLLKVGCNQHRNNSRQFLLHATKQYSDGRR